MMNLNDIISRHNGSINKPKSQAYLLHTNPRSNNVMGTLGKWLEN